MIHTERARLVDFLEQLDPDEWAQPTLSTDWSVELVIAHLSAAANTGRRVGILSIVAAGFNPAKHNLRLLSRYQGRTPEETLNIFRDSTTATIAPTKDYPAFLGEAIVHGQDIAEPLGLPLVPDRTALLEVDRASRRCLMVTVQRSCSAAYPDLSAVCGIHEPCGFAS